VKCRKRIRRCQNRGLNRRLIAADAKAVTSKVKDYRIDEPGCYKTMTLDAHEFIRS
jgi:hypothetical protein